MYIKLRSTDLKTLKLISAELETTDNYALKLAICGYLCGLKKAKSKSVKSKDLFLSVPFKNKEIANINFNRIINNTVLKKHLPEGIKIDEIYTTYSYNTPAIVQLANYNKFLKKYEINHYSN